MSLFKQLSMVDQRTKFIVNGWIRTSENQLKLENLPNSIINIVILYFRTAGVFDIFDQNGVKLSNDKTTITKIGDKTFYNSFGVNEILSTNKGMYEWNLEMISGGNHSVWIGVSSSYEIICEDYDHMKGKLYAVCNSGSYHLRGVGNHDSEQLPFVAGDKLKVILNLDKGQLLISKSNCNKSFKFSNIQKNDNTKYRLMVTLLGSACIKMNSFEQIN